MKRLFEMIYKNQHLSYNDLNSKGILILRVITGLFLLMHGLPKAVNPTSWMGDTFPRALQFIAVFFEVFGGLALIIGFLIPFFSSGIALTMLVAVFVHLNSHDPIMRLTISNSNEGLGSSFLFFPRWFVLADGRSPFGSGSAELAVLFLTISVCLLFMGGGKYSIDSLLLGRHKK